MQRNPAFTNPLASRHLSAAKSSGTGNLDPLDSEPQGRIDRLFHSPPEGHPAFELRGYRFSNQLGISLWPPNFLDVQGNRTVNKLFEVFLESFNLSAFLTD